MSLRTLENAILTELRGVTGNKKLKLKDLFEWSTSRETVESHLEVDEQLIECPKLGVWCSIRKACDG